MIKSSDRSGWFGASDSHMIMGNWNSMSFYKWWLEKLGVVKNDFTTIAMQTGSAYEHAILDWMGIKKKDRQIKKRLLRLRVNIDGETKGLITEIKTYSKDFEVTKKYWQQCQVEMFATKKDLQIAAYKVTEEEYANYFLPIDPNRLSIHLIDYDPDWISKEYLPRLKILAKCLRKKATPCEALLM